MMDQELLAEIKKIPGWMGDVELQYLHDQVKDAPPDAIIVEIGAWKGLSTAAQYKAIHDNQVVCTIDSWLGQADLRFGSHDEVTTSDVFLEFMDYMHELDINPQWYTPLITGPAYLRMLADDAVHLFEDKSIFRLILDGDHNAVGNDIDVWSPKIRPDGKICGHDWYWVGVKEQIEERLVIEEIIDEFWLCASNSESRK